MTEIADLSDELLVLGEIHQSLLDGKWYDCPDKDNTDIRCSTGAVPNLLLGNIIDHLGPYNGVWMGTIYC